MNYSGADYYRYKIIQGIQFDVRQCPDRNFGKPFKEETNINSENVGVCLSCMKKICTGTKECYEKRYGELLAERKNTGKEELKGGG